MIDQIYLNKCFILIDLNLESLKDETDEVKMRMRVAYIHGIVRSLITYTETGEKSPEVNFFSDEPAESQEKG